MHAAVRYFSRSGNTKLVADAIADAAHTQAVSADAPDATLSEHVDVLFIGGALYAYGLDKHLRDYVRSLDASQVGKAVVFSSAWLSRHALDILRNELGARGIQVEERDFFVKNKANADQLEQARQFARSFL
ncbi:MAG: flavodoxin domain-containing protein [Coriobacteriales bacterium]|nr:flavodoxin domain-containing protein [Coriobacteriales bacterium]